jgi:hypothetical protein
MNWVAEAVIALAMAGSVVGAIMLCAALEERNLREARREFFGLSRGKAPWP